MITMEELLALMLRQGGSDLHISVGSPPRIRIDGSLLPVEHPPLDPEDTRRIATSVLTSDQIARLDRDLELDCSFGLEGQGRFRVNVFYQQGSVGCVLRAIPNAIPNFEMLGMPVEVCQRICAMHAGLVLVTGATGTGKSTSLAAMVDHINRTRKGHIVTIEDPVEFTHVHKNCLINQREVGGDTHKFQNALRSVLRQDPDFILVGELRDYETIEAALTIAETGHLTFGTLHTSDAVQTINRIATPGIRALIRDGKAHQIYSQLQTGGRLGMRTMAQSLANLVNAGKVRLSDAEAVVPDVAELRSSVRAA